MKFSEMRYRFSAISQHIFPVHINGRVKIVRFSERNQFGNSVFFTSDRAVAEAIRKMPMFKRGAIQDITSEEELEALEKHYQTQMINKGVAEPNTVVESKTEGDDSATRCRTQEESKTEPESEEKDMFFANFTQAKEWVCKEYDIAKTKVRKPETLASIAKEMGVNIHYTEE